MNVWLNEQKEQSGKKYLINWNENPEYMREEHGLFSVSQSIVTKPYYRWTLKKRFVVKKTVSGRRYLTTFNKRWFLSINVISNWVVILLFKNLKEKFVIILKGE